MKQGGLFLPSLSTTRGKKAGKATADNLADLDRRWSTGKSWKTCLECGHFAERTSATRVDCRHAELVCGARLQFQALQRVVIRHVHHINVLQPRTKSSEYYPRM